MDPLSLAASIVALAGIADTTFTRGYRLMKHIENPDKSIAALFRDVNQLGGVLHSLSNIAQQLQSDEVYIDPTQTIDQIHACQVTLIDIRYLVDKTYLSGETQLPRTEKTVRWTGMRWPLSVSKSEELTAEISLHKHNLSLALNADSLMALTETLKKHDQIDKSVDEAIPDIVSMRPSLDANIAQAHIEKFSDRRKKMLSQLSGIDPWERQNTAIKLRHPGTGVWYTNSIGFREWLTGGKGKLWLHGIPGAGKTVIASSIIDESRRVVDEDNGLVFFYCDYMDVTTHDSKQILRSLIKQLVLQREDALEDLEDFLGEVNTEQSTESDLENAFSQKSDENFSALLSKISLRFKRVAVIIDGLNEIEQQTDQVVRLLHDLNSEDNTIKTLFTSRDLPDIKATLADHDVISIAARSDDLRLYVNFEIYNRIKNSNLGRDAVKTFMTLKSCWEKSNTPESMGGTDNTETTFDGQKILIQSFQSSIDRGQLAAAAEALEKLVKGSSQASISDGIQLVLLDAVKNGSIDVMKLLFQYTKDLDFADEDGNTLVHHAATNTETHDVLAYLLQNDAQYSVRNAAGLLPIHIICRNTSKPAPDMLREILGKGEHTNEQSLHARTPLQHAIGTSATRFTEYSIQVIDVLLDQDSPGIESKDSNGRTPLIELCRKLVVSREDYANPFKIDSRDQKYNESYTLVAEVIKKLTAKGADVRASDVSGKSALHHLCNGLPVASTYLAASTLLEAGADFSILDGAYKSSFEYLLRLTKFFKDMRKVGLTEEETEEDEPKIIDSPSGLDHPKLLSSDLEQTFERWQLLVKIAVEYMTVKQLELPLEGGVRPLSFALIMKDDELCKLLMAKGVDVDISDASSENSAVDVACDIGCSSDVARILLEKTQRDLNERTGLSGRTLLHRACISIDSISMIQQLIAAGVDLEVMEGDSGERALLIACGRGDTSIVKALLDAGAQTNARRFDRGGTALHVAVNANHLSCVKLLIDAGADIGILNSGKFTALMAAAQSETWPIANYLLEKGVEAGHTGDIMNVLMMAAEAGSDTTVRTILNIPKDLELETTVGSGGETPLLLAASSGSLATVELLVAAGSRLDARSKFGNIAHHTIMSMSLEILEYLLLQDIDWSATGEMDWRGNGDDWDILPNAALLHRAAHRSDSRVLKFLLTRGKFQNPNSRADPTAQITPLHIAARVGLQQNTEILLSHGADPLLVDQIHGYTAIHYAARFGCQTVVTELLKYDCGLWKEDRKGRIPAFCASFYGNQDIAKQIQKHLRDSNIANSKRPSTPAPATSRAHPPNGIANLTNGTIHPAPIIHSPSFETNGNHILKSPTANKHWTLPLKDRNTMANAAAGNTTIYAIDRSLCRADILELLEMPSTPGVACLDQHLKWQLNWSPAVNVGGSLDLLLPMEPSPVENGSLETLPKEPLDNSPPELSESPPRQPLEGPPKRPTKPKQVSFSLSTEHIPTRFIPAAIGDYDSAAESDEEDNGPRPPPDTLLAVEVPDAPESTIPPWTASVV